MKHLIVKSFGPIEQAEVQFGDLTLLVGPQASGKSIFLQLLKLLIDKYDIRQTLEQYNYIWDKDIDSVLNFYFGEGMAKIWKPESEIILDEKTYKRDFLAPKKGRGEGVAKKGSDEKLFYIPAQRILSISDGRPKTFMEFDPSAPYVLRQFSEILRLLLQNDKHKSVFPIDNRLKSQLRKSFNDSIFHDGTVVMDDRTGQKKLRMEVDGMSVPFITWSAGQKEFMPLLMGFYWLCPPSVAQKDGYKYVIIEEPEMGLHPQAIQSVILQIIDLLWRGYKVVISTHSPVLLEFAWTLNLLKKSKAKDKEDALYGLFDIKRGDTAKQLFSNLFTKAINTCYFYRNTNNKVVSKDISSLDAGNEDGAIASWGGLSQFSGKVTDIVSQYLTE